jgi:cyclopropane fatty-acyl-phospholipid synthase-like methyltransferase
MTSFPFAKTPSAKRHAPATLRNREAILQVLREVLPQGKTLEIASGTGEHAVHFAGHLDGVVWQPTDPNEDAVGSIAAYREEAALPRLLEPSRLDVHDSDWGSAAEGLDAIVCINMIHIAPWTASLALFEGAARHLPQSGPLVLYGPYRFHGAFTAPSNEAFDARLRGENGAWGVRDVDDIDPAAGAHRFIREQTVEMPANNHILVYRRRSG